MSLLLTAAHLPLLSSTTHHHRPLIATSTPFLTSTSPRNRIPRPRFTPLATSSSSSVPRIPSTRQAGRSSLDPLDLLIRGAVSMCSFAGVLPGDFVERWRDLVISAEEAESRLAGIPVHLVQAIMASEDSRFFYHLGVDFHGIARAVVNYPRGGGGSTITQQLMKRFFLTSERTMSRKFVEGFLSLVVERRLSKQKILYAYLSRMYWGHGIYGLESASLFYLGKHPSCLTLGESALLAGILPAPEFLNPVTNPSRGKSSQTRVLRRMVAAGFLDIETALEVASQPLSFYRNVEEQKWLKSLTYSQQKHEADSSFQKHCQLEV